MGTFRSEKLESVPDELSSKFEQISAFKCSLTKSADHEKSSVAQMNAHELSFKKKLRLFEDSNQEEKLSGAKNHLKIASHKKVDDVGKQNVVEMLSSQSISKRT